MSPFGFTTYRGSHGSSPKASISTVSTTYFIGPGRGAHASNEVLTITTQSEGSGMDMFSEIQSKDTCGDIDIPEYPLGAISGYNMQVTLRLLKIIIYIYIYINN